MDKRFILLPVSLNLFDGGAAAPAAGGEGGAAGNPAETNNTPGSSRQAKKAGDLSNVRYGKQPEAALSPDAGGEQGAKAPVAEPTPEEKRAKWDELVKDRKSTRLNSSHRT